MSDTDQERGQAMIDQAKGKAKEAVGSLTGDSSTEAEGKLDQLKGKAREGMADIKDKLNRKDEDQ